MSRFYAPIGRPWDRNYGDCYEDNAANYYPRDPEEYYRRRERIARLERQRQDQEADEAGDEQGDRDERPAADDP